MSTRLGPDVGGTFTELIFYDEASGETRVVKTPTTPDSPELGVVAAVEAGVPAGKLAAAGYFLHGTTVGLNALLERRGSVVGVLATRGFRDVIEIGRGDRAEMYDLSGAGPSRSYRASCGCRSPSACTRTARSGRRSISTTCARQPRRSRRRASPQSPSRCS